MIRSFYPVWVGPVAFRIERNGQILDKELFRAVLNGKQIDLCGTVDKENTDSARSFKEASEKAKLDKEIREILKERRTKTRNLSEPEQAAVASL